MGIEITRARADESCNACERYAVIKISLWILEGQSQAIRLFRKCLYELKNLTTKAIRFDA